MAKTGIESFNTTVQKTNIWLREIMDEEGWNDRHKAYIALRAVLHALRDRLVVDEAVHLGSQLPMLLRGMYFEGWDPSKTPLKIKTREEFLAYIEMRLEHVQPGMDAEKALSVVLNLLSRKISAGEIEDVKHSLPADIRKLWPESAVH